MSGDVLQMVDEQAYSRAVGGCMEEVDIFVVVMSGWPLYFILKFRK